MFVITLTYTVPVEEIDVVAPEHIEWLENHKAAGTLLASGRRVPRTGGVILAPSSMGAEKLAELMTQEPYFRHGLVKYEIVEFAPGTTAPGFELLSGI